MMFPGGLEIDQVDCAEEWKDLKLSRLSYI